MDLDDLGGIGRTLLTDDHGTWDPVVPADLHSNPLPPVAADGTAECWQCKQRFAFEQLDIANNAYVCHPCLLRTAQANTPAIDVENVSLSNRSLGRTLAVAGLVTAAIAAGGLIYYVMRV